MPIHFCLCQLPQQGPGHSGNWLQPFIAVADSPSFVSEASAAASSWLSFLWHDKVDTAFPQPIPHHPATLQARAKFISASLPIRIVVYAYFVPMYVECMVLTGRVKAQVFTRKGKNTAHIMLNPTWPCGWDESVWKASDILNSGFHSKQQSLANAFTHKGQKSRDNRFLLNKKLNLEREQ